MSQQTKFLTLDYLRSGTQTQQEVYRLLADSDLMTILSAHHPVLAGTVPLEIDIEGSDLDIICQFDDKYQFKQTLINHFDKYLKFKISEFLVHGIQTVIANFLLEIGR